MNSIATAIIKITVLLFAVSVHEASHAWMANRCGDPTAKNLGRITLNPIPHIDLFGSIILPIIMVLMPGGIVLGYAKPVPVNPYNLRNYKRDNMLVSIAGPGSNILLAVGALVIYKIFITIGIISPQDVYGFLAYLKGQSPSASVLILFFYFFLIINVVLMVFNLLPIPPLDGSGVIEFFLKGDALRKYHQILPYGFFILIGLLYFGIFGIIFTPIWLFATNLFLTI